MELLGVCISQKDVEALNSMMETPAFRLWESILTARMKEARVALESDIAHEDTIKIRRDIAMLREILEFREEISEVVLINKNSDDKK